MSLFPDDMSGANFSDDRKYRYLLWRKWDPDKSPVGFIGLNPSTANETEPDQTIGKVVKFAKSWGYGGVYMMNLFPYVSTDPDLLIECGPVELSKNDYIISQTGAKCADIIFAWGDFKQVTHERYDKFTSMFPGGKALVVNKNGTPRHPLYVADITVPVEYAHIVKMKKEVWQNAANQLVKLADIMETCEPGSREYKAYAKEYRCYAKIVMQ